jgi:hypothetical protein
MRKRVALSKRAYEGRQARRLKQEARTIADTREDVSRAGGRLNDSFILETGDKNERSCR